MSRLPPDLPGKHRTWLLRALIQRRDHLPEAAGKFYRVREGKLARAQMFYFDTAELAGFLATATTRAPAPYRPAADP